MTTPHPRHGLVVLLALLTFGGCSVSIGSSSSSRATNEVKERALETSSLTLDLSTGLSRAAVGMSEGESDVIIGHTGGSPPIAVTLTLPGGGSVERSVSDVSFRTRRSSDTEGEPTVVELYERNLSIDEAVASLDRAVDDLGIAASAVAEWAGAARSRTPEEGYAPRVLRGAGADPWAVEVGVNHSPGRGVVTIHTTLTHRD